MLSLRPPAFICGSLFLFTTPAAAQREPVLKQILVPHNYYYREMYLPQVTSGPSSVAWSPDGKSVVIAMAGALWRGTVGRSDGRMDVDQMTTGPGYDHQPDWSPDGRYIVYASYRDDAVQLRVLDANTLDDQALVSDGAVNLEPRWSPDGSRIAFVSTAFEGRWHLFLAEVQGRTDGQTVGEFPSVRPPVRLSTDLDSKLPRYYYSVFDHYISPTWSPDGKELILVSNHGKIWGSGGFWRMEAKPGAPMRSLYDEETTWKAKPDWSRDGKRVVYSSYLGRQWNQLWLMTGDGGDPLQLTYGDFDATEPRWSPDGRRIAYISNEGGNTALWLVEVPGGKRTKVEIGTRHYSAPVGRLRVTVVDGVTGKTLPARVSVTIPDGRSFVPDDAWRHADDGFDRRERRFEYGYFHTSGEAELTVPAGEATIEVTHGPEYQVFRETVQIGAGSLTLRPARLVRLTNLRAMGWTSGDLHIHMNYGGHYRATPTTLAFQARAEALNLAENLIVNKEDRMPDIGYFTGRPDPVSTPELLVVHDQEYHTSYWGHSGLLGLSHNVVLPGYAGYTGTPVASLFPDNATIADLAHAQGALYGYVHPFETVPDPADTTSALTYELPVDVALGKVDYIEIVSFNDHLATSAVWYKLLNCGFRLPAAAGTDAMSNFASLRGPVGTNRVYVQSPVPIEHHRWLQTLRAGKSMATNGPLVLLRANDVGLGGEVVLPASGGRVSFKVWLRSLVPVDHLQLIGNGEVVADISLRGDRTSADTTVILPLTQSGWYVLRAYADQAETPVLDIYPFGSTSPIYVSVGGKPIRNAEDADYFMKWLDRLAAGAASHPGWNTPQERVGVLDRIEQAKAEFGRRR